MGKYKVLSRDSGSNTRKFLVDTENDLNILPKNIGSIALVAETSDEYILNNKKEGIKIKENSSDSDSSDSGNSSEGETINGGEPPIIIEYTNGSGPTTFPMTRGEFLERVETCTLPRVFIKYPQTGSTNTNSKGNYTIECTPGIGIAAPENTTGADGFEFSAIRIDYYDAPTVVAVATFVLGGEDDNEPLEIEFMVDPAGILQV